MFPNDSTEEDRYRGVTIDSSKFGTEEVINAQKFESILNEVRVILVWPWESKLYNLHAASLHKVWSYIGPIKILTEY